MPALLITNARLVTADGFLDDHFLLAEQGVIVQMGPVSQAPINYPDLELLDAGGCLLSPGLIDSHIHGAVGVDFMAQDLSQEMIARVQKWSASHGLTGLLPTLGSCAFEQQKELVSILVKAAAREVQGAQILGIHLEGPYLNPKRRGAQPPEELRLPDISEMEDLLKIGQGLVRLITLAPELPGAVEMIRFLKDRGVAVSLGHSDAEGETALQAFEAGAGRCAHLFNAMSPLHHRTLGLAGSALAHPGVYTELVLDGQHMHPMAADIACRVKGADRILLVSDSNQAAGMPEGVYLRPGNRKIIVREGKAVFENGILAGSVLCLDQAVRNAQNFMGVSLPWAVAMASRNVAESLSLNCKGSLEPGNDADFILADEDFWVRQTFVKGKRVFNALFDGKEN